MMANLKYFNGDNQLQGVHERNGKLVGYVSKDDLYFVAGQGWENAYEYEMKLAEAAIAKAEGRS